MESCKLSAFCPTGASMSQMQYTRDISCNETILPCSGEVGGIYSVMQDPTHQVSMRLKLGVLSDHNGTYIVGPSSSPIADMHPRQPYKGVYLLVQ